MCVAVSVLQSIAIVSIKSKAIFAITFEGKGNHFKIT